MGLACLWLHDYGGKVERIYGSKMKKKIVFPTHLMQAFILFFSTNTVWQYILALNSPNFSLWRKVTKAWISLTVKVWTQFDWIQDWSLSELGLAPPPGALPYCLFQVRYIRIDGSVPSSERIHLVHQFQNDPDTRVAVLSIQAAGQVCTALKY